MFRWVELAFENSKTHLPFLRDFLTEVGIENDLKIMPTTEETWVQDLDSIKQEFDQIRLGKGLNELITSTHDSQIYFGPEMGWAECLVHSGNEWWPRSFFKEALLMELANLKSNIDARKSAIIIGAGGLAATAIAALSQYGFGNFLIVDPDEAKGQLFEKRLSKVFFSQEVRSDGIDAIIAKAADSSVVVNCFPPGQNDTFVRDFCYFNYLTSGGLVIDTNVHPVDSLLVVEARKVGIRSIPGYLIWGHADCLWIRRVLNRSLRLEEYQIRLRLVCARSTSA